MWSGLRVGLCDLRHHDLPDDQSFVPVGGGAERGFSRCILRDLEVLSAKIAKK